MTSNADGHPPKEDGKKISAAEETLKALNLQELLHGKKDDLKNSRDMANHRFWQTQPVPRFDEGNKQFEDGALEPNDLEKVPKDPYPLMITGFEWVTMDLTDDKELDEVFTLLSQNYVEDTEAMFRFKYSASFLNWALKAPGWRKEWHVGIRATESHKLVAFVSGVPITLRIRDKVIRSTEINFLCVHKKLRSRRLAPVLIKEITRRTNLVDIWQAIYTAGVLLPTPVSTCRYYHRSIDWPKLNEVGFSQLPAGSTKQRQVMKYKLPDRTSVNGVRPMTKQDVPAVSGLMKKYLDRMKMTQEFTEEEVEHWLLNSDTDSDEKVIYTYVVDISGHISDFFSFYRLESTIINNTKHDTLRVAYLFYYATEVAFEGDERDTSALKKRLNQLMHDALVLAKKANFDVLNALTHLDNPLFLADQKFGPGDGRLHYYLYNWRTQPFPGGIDEKDNVDEKRMGGVGVVML